MRVLVYVKPALIVAAGATAATIILNVIRRIGSNFSIKA